MAPCLLLACWSAGAWAAEAEPSAIYTVKPQDTLIALGRTVLVSPAAWGEVAKLNQLPNPNRIYPAQRLTVPLRLLRSSEGPAHITSVEGDVRVEGQPVQAGQTLAAGQTIVAAQRSSAVLLLGDGSVVLVTPLTQARLSEHRRYALKAGAALAPGQAAGSEGLFAASLQLLRGAVELAAAKVLRAKPLEVSTPTAVIGTRGTDYRVHLDEKLDTRTEVLDGRVRADSVAPNPASNAAPSAIPLAAANAAGAADGADVAAGFGAALRAGSAPSVVALPPAPDLSRLATLLERPALRLDLPESTTAPRLPLRLQVASDAQFQHLLRDEQLAPGEVLSLAGLPDGEWHLRARQIDPIGIWGFDAVHQFRLLQRGEAPEIVPLAGPQSGGSQALAWRGLAGVDAYVLEIAQDASFKLGVFRLARVEGLSARLILAEPGAHFWRVASVNAQGERGAWSEVGQLEILRP